MDETIQKRGRPRREFDLEQIRKLAELHMTKEEIASFFGCSKQTLYNYDGFIEAYEQGRATFKKKLREIQLELAQRNATMAIFLGKQYLDQKDTIEKIREIDNKEESNDPHDD